MILLAAVLLIAVYFVYPRQSSQEIISEFGAYNGFTDVEYDNYKRTSKYLSLSDGTKLAYDLFLPTKNGVPANEPLPTLFKYTPYNRAWIIFENGEFNLDGLGYPWYGEYLMRIRGLMISILTPDRDANIWDAPGRTEWLVDMLKSGYAVIVIDRPGTGASFGTLAKYPEDVAKETDQIFNWIADQTWSDGNIGMFGDSIQAQIQFQAASTGNPHLKAIFPATTWIDQYSSVMWSGGVWNNAFGEIYVVIQNVFNKVGVPIDSDTDGSMMAQARAERGGASALAAAASSAKNAPFRDFVDSNGRNVWIEQQALWPLIDDLNNANVPFYLINGWYDLYARDNFMIYENLDAPKKLLVRPTDHSGIQADAKDVDIGAEAHRWFDYWLKGIENGIMDEPPIHYYLQGAEEYKTSDVWPLETQEMTPYYFGPSETTQKLSVNNGGLILSAPTDSQGSDSYTVDYTTTTGTKPHWTAVAYSQKYPNMKQHDAKSLTYTTPPLETATKVVGHPVIHLWLSTEVSDLDAFAYLEEVDGRGNSVYVTQGNLRASHRTPGEVPFDNFGLPWYDHFENDLLPIPAGEPVELVFDLLPTAYEFSEGKSIRITIAFADEGNFDTPILDPQPSLSILRNSVYQSYVELPLSQTSP